MDGNRKKSTLRNLLIIAGPMVFSQASDTVMLFVDRLFLSRIGEEYLAASMSGGLTQLMISSFFIGTIGYVTAVVAQYYGAGKKTKCSEAAFQAIILAAASYPLLLAVSPAMRLLLRAVGQSPVQVDLAYTYFQTLIFGVVFLVLRHALAGFFVGIGRTTVVMAANAVGMLVNIPINYVLIFGKFGFPEMGLRGAAIGTIAGNFVIFVILLAFYLRGRNRSEFETHKSLSFRPDILRILLKFGIPAGIEMFLNIAAFNLFVQTMHTYGTRVAASVTIAFNWDIVSFLPMLGMGHAVTSLVGRNIGAGNLQEARKTAFTGLKTAWVYSGAMVVIFVVFAEALVSIFLTGENSAPDSEVRTLAVVMLRLASLYLLADSAQLVFVGALRGAGDTRWVMSASVAIHWVFTSSVFILIKFVKVNPVTAWICFIGFIIILGFMMFFRFRGGKWMELRIIDGSDEPPDSRYSTGACPEIISEEPLDDGKET